MKLIYLISIVVSFVFLSEISLSADSYSDCLKDCVAFFNKCSHSSSSLDECEVKYKSCANSCDSKSRFESKKQSNESYEDKAITYWIKKEEEFQECIAKCDKQYNITSAFCGIGTIAEAFSWTGKRYGTTSTVYNSCIEQGKRELERCYNLCNLKYR